MYAAFYAEVMEKISIEEDFLSKIVFIDEAMFQFSETVNCHNVQIWGLERPCSVTEPAKDSPKVNVFCALSVNKAYGPFFLVEQSILGTAYPDMMEMWLMPQLE
jgi:hypothetical protein